VELAKAAKQERSVERSLERREEEKMVVEASVSVKKGDGTGVVDAGKLPEQKEIIAKQRQAARA